MMTYSTHSRVRPIGGRLALDFLNTANWSVDGQVFEEKIETHDDLDIWIDALGLSTATHPLRIPDLHQFRNDLRSVFHTGSHGSLPLLAHHIQSLDLPPSGPLTPLTSQPILGLVAVSALSILSDGREFERVKTCPGANCGWVFIDETKNARRKWCIMETCGNRAKAARNYARKSKT